MKKFVLVVAVIAIILSMTFALTACEPQYTLDVTGRPSLEEMYPEFPYWVYLHQYMAMDDYMTLALVKVGDVVGGIRGSLENFPIAVVVEVEVLDDVFDRGFEVGETVNLAFSTMPYEWTTGIPCEEVSEIVLEWVTQQEYMLVLLEANERIRCYADTFDTYERFWCENIASIYDILDRFVVGINNGKVDFDCKAEILKDICPDGKYSATMDRWVFNWKEYISDGMTLETLQENMQTLAEEVQLTLASQQQ